MARFCINYRTDFVHQLWQTPTVFFFFFTASRSLRFGFGCLTYLSLQNVFGWFYFFANISGVYYDNRYSSAFRAFDRFTINESLNISATLEHLSQQKYTSQPTSKQLAAMLRQKCQWMPVRCYIKLLSAFPQVIHLGENCLALRVFWCKKKLNRTPLIAAITTSLGY